jgi:peptidoglycan-associated lipoprotein
MGYRRWREFVTFNAKLETHKLTQGDVMRSIRWIFLVLVISTFFSGCHRESAKISQEMIEEQAPAPPIELTPQPAAPAPEVRQVPVLAFEDVNFGFDRYDLTEKAREILTRHAQKLRTNPQVRIRIEGHCDEMGTIEYNLALGEKRANTVKDYLVNLGVDAERISTISYGKERPLDPRHTEEAWAKNRRAHFVIVK